MKPKVFLYGALVAFSMSHVQAAPRYWDASGGDGLWSNADNWSDVVAGGGVVTVPGSSDTAFFSATGLVTPQVISLSGPQSAAGLDISTAGVTTLQGVGSAQTLSLGSGGINVSNTAVTAVNIGPSAGTLVNVLVTADQSWLWGGSNSGSQGIFVRGTVQNSGGAHTLTLGGGVGSTAISVISGAISDGDGTMSITLNGSSSNNRWNLGGNNSYSGLTTITSGGLGITSGNALGSTSAGTTVASGAGLFIRASIPSIAAEPLSITGTGPSSGGALRNVTGDSTWNGTITLTGASYIGADGGTFTLSTSADIGRTAAAGTRALTFVGAGNIIVNGDLAGDISVTRGTSGVVRMNGDSKAYTGATSVSTTGTLVVNTALTGTSGVSVTGTLRGDGGSINTAATVTVNGGGVLAPGSSTVTPGHGTLSMGAISLASTSTLSLDFTSGTLQSDLINSTGNFTLAMTNDAILSVADLGLTTVPIGTIIELVKYTGTWNGGLFTVGGTVIADESTTFTVGSNTFQANYDGVSGAGKAFSLVAVVPEPSSVFLVSGGVLALALRRRRCRGFAQGSVKIYQ